MGITEEIRKLIRSTPGDQLLQMQPVDVYRQLGRPASGTVKSITSVELQRAKNTLKEAGYRPLKMTDLYQFREKFIPFRENFKSWEAACKAIETVKELAEAAGGMSELVELARMEARQAKKLEKAMEKE